MTPDNKMTAILGTFPTQDEAEVFKAFCYPFVQQIFEPKDKKIRDFISLKDIPSEQAAKYIILQPQLDTVQNKRGEWELQLEIQDNRQRVEDYTSTIGFLAFNALGSQMKSEEDLERLKYQIATYCNQPGNIFSSAPAVLEKMWGEFLVKDEIKRQ